MLTEQGYKTARARYDAYIAELDPRSGVIPPEISAKYPDVTNELTSQIEVYEFLRDRPDRYFLYVQGDSVHTWMGDKLGTITRRGNVFRSNFRDQRQWIEFRAITGDRYGGYAYLSAGDYARVRKLKG